MLRLVTALVLASTPASAAIGPDAPVPADDVDGIELQWHAPPQCPDAAQVRAHLRSYLGNEREPSSHTMSGTIVAEADGWRLDLDIDGARRELRSQRCEALAEAAAVVLSLAMDAAREEPPKPPAPVLAPMPPAAVVPALDLRAAPGRIALRLDSGMTYGLAPPAADAALAVGWLWPQARVELRGLFITPGATPVTGGDRLRIFQGSVGPRGCYVVRLGRFELPLCGGVHFGVQRVEVRPARRNPARHIAWAGIDAGAALVWPVHRNVALWLGGEAIVAAVRGRLPLPGGATWRPGPAAIRATIGVEARFFGPGRKNP